MRVSTVGALVAAAFMCLAASPRLSAQEFCPPTHAAPFSVALHRFYRLPEIPVSVSGYRGDSALALTGSGTLLVLAPGSLDSSRHSFPGAFLVRANLHAIIVGSAGALWMLQDLVGDSPDPVLRFGDADSLSSFAASPNWLWLSKKSDDGFTLASYRISDRARLASTTFANNLPQPVVLHELSLGTVLAAEIEAPFTVRVLDGHLRILWTGTLGNLVPPDSTPRGVVSHPAMPIGCNRVIQTLSDLRSDQRRLVVYHMAQPRALRVTPINDPLSFVQSIPDQQLLIGFSDRAGGRGVVVYRWDWR